MVTTELPACFVCRRPIVGGFIVYSTFDETGGYNHPVCSLACLNVVSDPQGTGAWQD